MATEREPEADAALRRELPNLRAAWRLARGRGSLDDAGRDGHRAVRRGRLPRPGRDPRLGRGAGRRPGARGTHPRASRACWAPRRRPPTTAATIARAERLARAGLRAGDRRRRVVVSACRRCRWSHLARGAYADVVEHSLAAAAVATAGPRDNLGVAALAMAYAGDLDAGAGPERAGAGRRGVADDAVVGRLRRRRDREPPPAGTSWPSSTTSARSSLPAARGDLSRRRRDRRAAHRAAPAPAGSHEALRGLPRGHRLLRPHRQLDPSVGHPAQPGRPAAPAGRPRAGGAARRRRRPGAGCARRSTASRAHRSRAAPADAAARSTPGGRPGRGPAGDRAQPRPSMTAGRPAPPAQPARPLDERLLADPGGVAARRPGRR